MQSVLFFSYLASILISVIFAFIYRHELKSQRLFILFPYLVFVFLQEFILYFYLLRYPHATTGIIYNFYRPITVLVFSVLYLRIPFKLIVKRIILLLLIVYSVFTLITFTFLPYPNICLV